MTLADLYKLVLKFGIDKDPRSDKNSIKSYPDTAILYGQSNTLIKKILVGIDMEGPELLLADRLRSKEGLDLVLAHHPEGRAFAAFYEVMKLQVDLLARAGISDQVAKQLLDERKREVERRVLPQNHMRSADFARILNIPFMCVHTPADNHVAIFIEDLLISQKPDKIQDIVDILEAVPEYHQAKADFSGPRIILGSPKRPVGKIFVEMTGGTEGSKDVYDKLYKKGIRTLVGMHLSEEHFKKVKDVNLNVVIAGHISSDNLGLNLLLDRIEKKEKLEIIGCSGFTRIKRK